MHGNEQKRTLANFCSDGMEIVLILRNYKIFHYFWSVALHLRVVIPITE